MTTYMNYEINEAGFFQFDNRDWNYPGDKGTWARMEKNGTITVQIAKHGAISEKYDAELDAFLAHHGQADVNSFHRGDRINFTTVTEEPEEETVEEAVEETDKEEIVAESNRVYVMELCGQYIPTPGETLNWTPRGWRGSRFSGFADKAAAVEFMSADGWMLEENTDSKMVFVHLATLKAKEERDAYLARQKWEAEHQGEWVNAKNCYLRFGKVPACGYSTNHADGSREAGVSVYRGERLADGTVRPIFRTNQELVGWMNFAAMNVPLYIVTGQELDACGTDGEPLLTNCRIWRKARNVEQ